MQITDLPDEILDLIIVNLPVVSVQALQLTNKALSTHIATSATIQYHIFHSYYNDNRQSYTWSHPHPDWNSLILQRRSAQVHTWGALAGGRLGFTARDIHDSPYASNISRQGFNQGVVRATPIPGLKEAIRAVSGGGFSFQILTVNGDIYSTGTSWHYGHQSSTGPDVGQDYNQLIELAREQERRQRDNWLASRHGGGRTGRVPGPLPGGGLRGRLGGIQLPGFLGGGGGDRRPLVWDVPGAVQPVPETMPPVEGRVNMPGPGYHLPQGEIGNPQLKKCGVVGDKEVKFTSVDSGRAHFVALSEDSVVYSFDSSPFGIPLKFVNKSTGAAVLAPIKRVRSGWDYNLVEFYGLGLAYWTTREPLAEGQQFSSAKVSFISRNCVDFVGLEGKIIFIANSGTIWCHDKETNANVELLEFMAKLGDLNDTAITDIKAVRLAGFFRTFVVFSNIDICLFSDSGSDVTTISELNGTGCVDVQIGDYHSLALLASGKVLSWGLESKMCGCLGLGTSDEASAKGASRSGDGLRVTIPTELEIEGKAVGIASGGWQSCAVVMKE